LRRRLCPKESIQVAQVDRSEEEDVQQQPQREAAKQHYRNGFLHITIEE